MKIYQFFTALPHMEHTGNLPERQNLDKEQVLLDLKKAKNAEERVKMFADIMDKKGLDFLLGLIPGLGDAVISAVATAYLLAEAKKAKVPVKDMWKITTHQAIDFGLGAVPLIGDIADFFNKSHQKSLTYFTQKTQELRQEAERQGADQEEINKILSNSEKIHTVLKKNAAKKEVQTATRYFLNKLSNIVQKKK